MFLIKHKYKNPITINQLYDIGFIDITPKGITSYLIFVHRYSGCLIESNMWINAGGFNHKGEPIYCMEQVKSLIKKYRELK